MKAFKITVFITALSFVSCGNYFSRYEYLKLDLFLFKQHCENINRIDSLKEIGEITLKDKHNLIQGENVIYEMRRKTFGLK
jgi:hypothetical protein